MKDKNKKGFVAITIVLSVTGIILALVVSLSIDSALFFDQARAKIYRAMNYYYAYNCIDQATLFLAHDYFFEPDSPVIVKEHYCQILSVEKQGNKRNIRTVGNFKNANVYRSAVVEMDIHGLKIVSID